MTTTNEIIKKGLVRAVTEPALLPRAAVIHDLPEKIPTHKLWATIDYYLSQNDVISAKILLENLKTELHSAAELSLWYTKEARTRFMQGDYLGSIKSMQISIKMYNRSG